MEKKNSKIKDAQANPLCLVKKFSRRALFAVIALSLQLIMVSGCAEVQAVTGVGKPQLQRQSVVSEDEFKKILLDHLWDKYEKKFEITYIGKLQGDLCSFHCEAKSVPEGDKFDIYCALYKDGTLTSADKYFQYLIREDYEKHISDIVSTVCPENKVYAEYSDWNFEGYDKNSSFDDFMKTSDYADKAFIFNIYILEENGTENMNETTKKIGDALLESGYDWAVYIYAVRNDGDTGYQTLSRTVGTNSCLEQREWRSFIRFSQKLKSYDSHVYDLSNNK